MIKPHTVTTYYAECDRCGATGPLCDTAAHAETFVMTARTGEGRWQPQWMKIGEKFYCNACSHPPGKA